MKCNGLKKSDFKKIKNIFIKTTFVQYIKTVKRSRCVIFKIVFVIKLPNCFKQKNISFFPFTNSFIHCIPPVAPFK